MDLIKVDSQFISLRCPSLASNHYFPAVVAADLIQLEWGPSVLMFPLIFKMVGVVVSIYVRQRVLLGTRDTNTFSNLSAHITV